jgi:outer membrane receptor for ferrienterochelin and colicin
LEEGEKEHEEEVVVTVTRISRTITNIPTRVEVISGEELAEKGNMKPGDIRMLLNESTGIHLQEKAQTSDPKRDYHYNTFGIFVQNAWSISDKFTLESGLRGDYVNEYGFEMLTRLKCLYLVVA